MNVEEFTTIKDKVRKLELESAAAKGKIETIESSWERKYGFKTLDAAEKKVVEIEKEISEKENSRNILMDKLKNSFDWEKI